MCDATDGGFGIGELAERAGFTARTIRYYTTEGLLPQPRRRGRCAVYDETHLARLELIRTLQSAGLSLAAIGDYLRQIPDDADRDTIVLHGSLLAPWSSEPTELLADEDLHARAGRPLTGEEVELLGRLGIVEPAPGGVHRVRVRMLSDWVRLLDGGVTAEAAEEAHAIIEEHVTAIAEELTDVFRRRLWPPYRDHRLPRSRLLSITDSFRPLVLNQIVSAVERAVDDTKHRAIMRRL